MSGTVKVTESSCWMEVPSAHIRFVLRDEKKILQQQWAVSKYEGGCPIEQHGEWRDVPLVEEE